MPQGRSNLGRARPVLVLVASLAVVAVAETAHASGPTTWTVRPGDVLGTIAQRFGVSIDDLERWNDLEDDSIRVGQELRVDESAPEASHQDGIDYSIGSGDTLGGIASRFGTTIDALVALNPGLDPDHIRAGRHMVVGQGRRVDYQVSVGDTLVSIADVYRVAVRDIVRWNQGLDADHIRQGAHLTIYSRRPPSLSESIGLPYDGHLEHAVRLPQRPGYVLRDRDKAWGTRETVDLIEQGFAHLREEDRHAPTVEIHDLSDRRGGRLSGHHSHQSGRDADIAYFQKDCAHRLCTFRRVDPDDLDAARIWELIEPWLRGGQVDMIFMDYALQRPLYEYARSHGATSDELRHWFQYPSPESQPAGIIRNFPNHRDHMHVRFVCPPTDHQCIGRPWAQSTSADGN